MCVAFSAPAVDTPLHIISPESSSSQSHLLSSNMRKLPDPRPWISSFKEENPRAYGGLYQIALYAATFQCAVAMARYLPYSLPSDVGSGVANGTNSTTERMCKWGAREQEVAVGGLAVRCRPPSTYSSLNTDKDKRVLPYFILCPSTFTVILCTIIFFPSIIKLQFLNRDDIWQSDMMFFMVFSGTIFPIVDARGHRILMLIQILLPINIWTGSFFSAVVHPAWRFWFPGNYALCAEIKRKQREEWAKKAGEGRRRAAGDDLEGGMVENGTERAVVDEGINENTPLTGQGFARMDDGPHVEHPHSRDVEF